MKKVVLVLVCSVVIIVFVALNYLLWERENNIKSFENIENLSASKSANIDALGKEIKDLDDINSDLKKKISDLEDNKKLLQDINSKSVTDNQNLKGELSDKDDLIFALKQQADLTPFEGIIKKWVESVDKGQYESAFQLQSNLPGGNKDNPSLNDFLNKYKSAVKSMKLKSFMLVAEETKVEKKGDLVFKVELEVKKTGNESGDLFTEGQNERYFAFSYNKVKKNWEISKILTSY